MVLENHLTLVKKQKQRQLKTQTLLPMITIVVILTITSFVSIAKGSMNEVYGTELPEIGGNAIRLDEKGLNASEANILRTLFRVLALSDTQLAEGNSTSAIYFNFLKRQLGSNLINIEKPEADKIIGLIGDMNGIMNLEKIRETEKMSIDGREVATYIAKQIYKACGLNLTNNLEGEIVGITDQTGNDLYVHSQAEPGKINIYALVFTLLTITVLMSICVIIARKNQLFIKDVEYDGFNEKGYT